MQPKNYFRIFILAIFLYLIGRFALFPGYAQEGISQESGLSISTLGTGFTYQGQLSENNAPASGPYDFRFRLFDAASSGSQVGSNVVKGDVAVSSGLFSVEIDFGNVFDGTALWLEVAVRTGSSTGSYTVLNPRQPLTAAPYAVYSQRGAWSGLSGIPAGFADDVDDDTTYTAGAGLALNGANQFRLTVPYRLPQACASGEIVLWDGSAWVCAGEDTHDHWGQTWSGSGWGLMLIGGDIGIIGLGSSQGVFGSNASTSGDGVYGEATAATGFTNGVFGLSESVDGDGVFGLALASSGRTSGVQGQSDSTSGTGVTGVATSNSGQTTGVWGGSASTDGRGVSGYAMATNGTTYGVYGQSDSNSGIGVYGRATAASGFTSGVFGQADSSTFSAGVTGVAMSTSGTTYGVWGESASTDGRGVSGYATAANGTTYGVYGQIDSSTDEASAVFGYATAASGVTNGVKGRSDSSSGGAGVYGLGYSSTGLNYGVYGATNSPNGYAGQFAGRVVVGGDFAAAGTKSFIIDHPLDPQNQYLYHYSVESSEVVNQYSGNVMLDAAGMAWVQLPDWFEAINSDYRYQLTPIGAAMPDLHIAQEIQGNSFQIAGGEPGKKVSWMVTALRSDLYLQKNPHLAEVAKTGDEAGAYLNPELYGQPETAGIHYLADRDGTDKE